MAPDLETIRRTSELEPVPAVEVLVKVNSALSVAFPVHVLPEVAMSKSLPLLILAELIYVSVPEVREVFVNEILELVVIPVVFVETTDNLAVGVAVPMPTFPALTISP